MQTILFFVVEEPKEELPKLLDLLQEFGQYAAFFMNKKKSKLMFKNVSAKEQQGIVELAQCEAVQKVKYLGVELSPKNIDLYRNNYVKLWNKIKMDLLRWNKLQLSLLGRIATVKMTILSKILYSKQFLS